MAEIVACPNCQRQLQVPEDYIGKTVQCPDCQHQFQAALPTSGVQSTPPSPKPEPPPRRRNDEDEDDHDEVIDDISVTRGRTHQTPHRAAVVLILGILAICCIGAPITGIVAWILGHMDIKEMDAGRMDPSGRSQTQTGKVLGMISVILTVLGTVGYCLILFFVMGIGAMQGPRRRRF